MKTTVKALLVIGCLSLFLQACPTPVGNSTPDKTPAPVLSANNSLKSLVPSEGSLSPAYSNDVTDYAVSVANTVSAITIRVDRENPKASVVGCMNGGTRWGASEDGQLSYPLIVGNNHLEIQVRAENDDVRIINLNITRAGSSNVTLNYLNLSANSLSPRFSSQTYNYICSVANSTTYTLVNAATADSNATLWVRMNGGTFKQIQSGQYSPELSLNVGNNALELKVIAQDSSEALYSINVTRAGSANALLSDLWISTGYDQQFSSYLNAYSASVANGVGSVSLVTHCQDVNSTTEVKINQGAFVPLASGANSGDLPLLVGSNIIQIKVTSQSGATNSYSITITRAGSSNFKLASLDLSSGSLNPGFSSNVNAYTASVNNSVSSLKVTPTPMDAGATTWVRVNSGEYTQLAFGAASPNLSLKVGDNYLDIKVVAQTGISTVYTITVKRAKSSNALLSSLSLSKGTLDPVFDSQTHNYTTLVSNNTGSVSVTAVKQDMTAKIMARVNNGTYVLVYSDNVSDYLPLNVGSNTIEIQVTAEDGSVITYSVVVTRDLSENALLSALVTSAGTINPVFKSGINNYTVTVDNLITTATVTPTSADANATVALRINGGSFATIKSGVVSSPLDLNIGSNQVDIRVTAPNGNTNTYGLVITRLVSNNSYLSVLHTFGFNVSPDFNQTTTAYTATVNNSTTSVSLRSYAESVLSTIQVRINSGNWAKVDSQGLVADLAVNVGLNLIELLVTAADGSTRTYTISLTRLKSDNCYLSNLVLTSGPFDKAFQPFTYSYSANVPLNTGEITLNPSCQDPGATIKYRINGSAFQTLNIGDAISLASLITGNNTIDVRVTAPNGTSYNFYTIKIHRISNNADLSNLQCSSSLLSPAFSSDNFTYTAAANGQTSVRITPQSSSGFAKIQVRLNGGSYASVNSGSQSEALDLIMGSNTIDVQVQSEDGSTTKTYSITIIRLSNVASIASLEIPSGDPFSSFSSSVYVYGFIYENRTTSVTVKPVTTHPNATVSVKINEGTSYLVAAGASSPSLALNEGDNVILLTVTAEDGFSTQQYAFKIRRESSNGWLSGISLSSGVLSPVFASGTMSYSAGIVSVDSIKITPTAAYAYSQIRVAVNASGYNYVTSGGTSPAMPLNMGDNTIRILVESEDGLVRNYYTVTIKRLSADADLSDLQVSSKNISLSFKSNQTVYTSSVVNAVESINITPTLSNANASVKFMVNNVSYQDIASGSETPAISLKLGSNYIDFTVTAEDGVTSKTYLLIIYRKSNNPDLSALKLSVGSLSPAFKSTTFNYSAGSTNQATVQVTPTSATSGTDLRVRVNGGRYEHVISNSPSSNLNLNMGDNTIDVEAVSEDSSQSRVYSIVIHRKSNNANLANLVISQGTLSPAFNSDATSYTASASYTQSMLSLTPSTVEAGASIELSLNDGPYSTITSGTSSGNLALQIGANTVNLRITAEDGQASRNYTLVFTSQYPALSLNNTLNFSGSTPCNGVALSADGSRALVAGYGCARLYDTDSGTLLQTFDVNMAYPCEAVALSADGSKALVGGFGEARLFNSYSGALLNTFSVYMNSVCKSVALSANGTIALVAGFGEARSFDTANGSLKAVFGLYMNRACEAVALNSDGSMALVGGNGEARLFNTGIGIALKIFYLNMDYVCEAVALNADASLALIGGYGEARLFNTYSELLLKTFTTNSSSPCAAVALSANGKIALVGGFGDARLIATESGSVLQTINLAMGYIQGSVAMDYSGTQCLFGRVGTARVYR